MPDPSAIAPLLLDWYDTHARKLPWRVIQGQKRGRRAIDPYRVWLSEIMLQQTTVAAVKPYFRRFLARWPTLAALARSPQEDVLAVWAGLGYYSRARNLHACAQILVRDHGGVFPRTSALLQKLPGIGPYTAAAVAAIAYGEPATVVDGNVERVVARLFACQTPLPKVKPELRTLAATLTPKMRAGDYAQAMMDLGATLCTPRTPECGRCPVASQCRALALGLAPSLPQRLTRKPKPVRRGVAFWLTDEKGRVWLRRRPPKGLLGGMLEIPSSDWIVEDKSGQSKPGTEVRRARQLVHAPVRANWRLTGRRITHTFTHFTLELDIAEAQLTGRGARPGGGIWTLPDLDDETETTQALPTVMRKIVTAMRSPPLAPPHIRITA